MTDAERYFAALVTCEDRILVLEQALANIRSQCLKAHQELETAIPKMYIVTKEQCEAEDSVVYVSAFLEEVARS